MNTKWSQVIIMVALAAILGVSSCAKAMAAKPMPSRIASIEDILWWLPEDTETVTAARGPYKITDGKTTVPASALVSDALQNVPLTAASLVGRGELLRQLAGRTLAWSVEGSRQFRRSADLGLMPFEGCSILIFEPSSALGAKGRDPLAAWLDAHASRRTMMAGMPVAVLKEKIEQDQWQFFIAHPRPGVLLCATNEAFMRSVLERMKRRGQRRALPSSLPEWKQVDRTARFWAVRHFDKSHANLDPSSPLNRQAELPPQGATAVTFFYDPDRFQMAKVRYLSTHLQAPQQIAAFWRDAYESGSPKLGEWQPRIRRIESGTVEFALPLKPAALPSFLFILMGTLGHIIAV